MSTFFLYCPNVFYHTLEILKSIVSYLPLEKITNNQRFAKKLCYAAISAQFRGVTRGGWRWLSVVSGGQGEREGGRGRRGEQGGQGGRGFVLGITRGDYRWLLEVVGGG
nr:uncharacterized protein LOC124213679 [Neodiprion pinetum]